jgi:hypothetical protein
VVSIAFAKIGFVLLRTIPSKMFPPCINDLFEVREDGDSSDDTPQRSQTELLPPRSEETFFI